MGRQASPWPAILTGPDQILGVRWLSLFRAAPRPVQQALLAVGSQAPGRSVRWGNLRTLHPISGRYRHDRNGDVLEVKGANYSRRFGNQVRCHVVDLDRENTEADLFAEPNVPGGLSAGFFGCMILIQVLQFLAPEQALRSRPWASIAPGGILLITVQALGRLDAALWGLSAQDLSSEELDVNGPCSPLVACAHADKPA